jgi:ribosomal protein S18 acetylase RimI-like enzyme
VTGPGSISSPGFGMLDRELRMTTAIREITDDDVDQVVRLWAASGVARPWNDPAKDIEFARRGPHSTILVAVEEGRVMATAMVGEDGHRGWVYYVAVSPESQGIGLGRQIMDAAEAWLKKRGVWKMQVLIRADNETVKHFYERLGYRNTNVTCFQKILSHA